MEFVKCEECVCWNQALLRKDTSKSKTVSGYCMRHAPRPSISVLMLRCIAGLLWFKTDYNIAVLHTLMIPQTEREFGCWEGIRKEE